MATFVLIHGGGGTAMGWRFVAGNLEKRGHEVVAVDLPCDDPDAVWNDYTETVVDAIGDRTELVVVAHSAGGFVAPLVCDRVSANLMVFVAGMVPAFGETFEEWWDNTDHGRQANPDWEDPNLFYNDVPPDLAAEDTKLGEGRENFPTEKWPLENWPDTPMKFLLCRDDRLFPPHFMRKVVDDRLGIVPEEMGGGHCAILSRPDELAERLDFYWKEMV